MTSLSQLPRIIAFAFAIAIAAVLAPATTAQAAGAHGGSIDGVWNSNIGAVYEITQHAGKFLWWSEKLNETAMGTIDGSTIRATWSGTNGAGSGTASITYFDGSGRARRIEWSNGVVFTR